LCWESLAVAPDPDGDPKSPERGERLRSLRRKLSKLNRAPLPEETGEVPSEPAAAQESRPSPPSPPPSIVYLRDLPRVEPPRVPAGGGICIPLEECLDGCEAPAGPCPPFYLLERSVTEAEPEASELPPGLARALDVLAGREDSPALALEDLCFLDIETTGLGTLPVFLIGTLVCRDGDIVCRQFLARNYAEEGSIVRRFAEQMRQAPCLVTFNGKTFDVPFLRMRAAATGVRFPEARAHFDLLHEARRVFRGRLPDCKLKTLERYVCERYRGDDIPGSDIPRAYHDFVRTGDAREIALIVKHNLWDLVTMVHLMTKILLAGEA
jgi:hypothetical protein